MVSVVIPTRGRPSLLTQALSSVERQDLRDLEVIVIHDGDGEVEVASPAVRSLALTVLHLPPGSGAAVCRNRGVAEAHADKIAFLDDDDLWHPAKLARQVERLRRRPDVGLLSTDFYRFDTDCGAYQHVRSSSRIGRDPEAQVAAMLAAPVAGPTSCYLVRRDSFEAVGGFDESLPSAQDYDLGLRLLHAGVVLDCLAEPLVYYRTHRGNLSLRAEAKEIGMGHILTAKERLFPVQFQRHRRQIELDYHLTLAWTRLAAGQGRAALASGLAAARTGRAPLSVARTMAAALVAGAGLFPILAAAHRRLRSRRLGDAQALLDELLS